VDVDAPKSAYAMPGTNASSALVPVFGIVSLTSRKQAHSLTDIHDFPAVFEARIVALTGLGNGKSARWEQMAI
jgi:hypothetical protein